jgi:outer membrane protein TolC
MKGFRVVVLRRTLLAAVMLALVFSQPRQGGAQQDARGPSLRAVAGDTAVPITLAAAIQLAEASNLDIAQAREAVNQARAALLRAQVQLLPNFNLGSIYTHHEGTAAKTEGNIIFANKDSLFVGGGPSLLFQTTDALFGPAVARQLTAATQAGAQRVDLETLITVIDAYLAVQLARRRLARADDTLETLTSEEPAASRAKLKGALPLIRDFVKAGGKEALESDLARLQVEVLRRREERAGILQDYRVQSAELARLLRLDPQVALLPLEDMRYPMPLAGESWYKRPTDELVGLALANRPELAENQALVQAALTHVRAAKLRPFLPNVALNYSWGDFGGSPDPNPPIKQGGKLVSQPGFGPSGRILHFDPRTDFDVSLFWRLQNMGLGNRAEVRESESIHRQAMLRRQAAYDRVIAQVVQAQENARDWAERLTETRAALFDAAGAPKGPVYRALLLNFERIKGGEGRPLEVVDSIRLMADSLEAYAQAVTGYERAQLRLMLVLGLPVESVLQAEEKPVK